MKSVIVTEKPSVARQFAAALGVSGSHQGYIENDKWIITWCVGHLVTLSYPDKYDPALKNWSMDALPFLPEHYKYEVIAASKDQFKVVKQILNRSDAGVIYNAGDSGREGEYIQRLVYIASGIMDPESRTKDKKKILRVWINSQTDEEIKRGIRDAKPEKEYDSLASASFMRGIEDYAVGINLSRALTLGFAYGMNRELGTKKYIPIAAGRVMTCVLAMVVNRENEIRNFVPTDYYRIDAKHEGFTSHWKAGKNRPYYCDADLYSDTGFRDRKKAEALEAELEKDPFLMVSEYREVKEKKGAPLLYNLAELQSDCSKMLHISPDDTLSIAQSLYEKKLTTYPRTDARVLSSAVAKEIDKNIRGLAGIPDIGPFAEEILKHGMYSAIGKSRYTDDSKITDHYAIIPTGETGSLSGLEEKVYLMIVRRFLAIFCPPAEYKKVTVLLNHSTGEIFTVQAKQLVSRGHLAVMGKGKEDGDAAIPVLKQGEKIPAKFGTAASTTQPPKRYTSGSMVLAMENAGNLIEDEDLREQIKGAGIGTSATRAGVITKLCKDGYLSLEKKTQVLMPTKTGFAVDRIVMENVPSMRSPEMTASWEKGLSGIESGDIDAGTYESKLNAYIRKMVEGIKKKAESAPGPQPVEKKEAGTCPVCGKKLFETDKGYFCEGRKKTGGTCRFAFGKAIGGKMLPEEEVKKLLSGQPTSYMDLIGKSGKPFRARIVLAEKGECRLEFPHEDTGLVCPKCGKKMTKTTYRYECTCGLSVWAAFSGRPITEEEMDTAFRDKVAGPLSGFRTKSGTDYSAWLCFDGETAFTANTVLCGHRITKEDLLELMEKGKTGPFTDFVSKAGKQFSAGLKLENGSVHFDFGGDRKKPKGRKKTYGRRKT